MGLSGFGNHSGGDHRYQQQSADGQSETSGRHERIKFYYLLWLKAVQTAIAIWLLRPTKNAIAPPDQTLPARYYTSGTTLNNDFPQPLPLFEAANGGRHVGQAIALANQGNDLPVGQQIPQHYQIGWVVFFGQAGHLPVADL